MGRRCRDCLKVVRNCRPSVVASSASRSLLDCGTALRLVGYGPQARPGRRSRPKRGTANDCGRLRRGDPRHLHLLSLGLDRGHALVRIMRRLSMPQPAQAVTDDCGALGTRQGANFVRHHLIAFDKHHPTTFSIASRTVYARRRRLSFADTKIRLLRT
jgi:hypothetical protein